LGKQTTRFRADASDPIVAPLVSHPAESPLEKRLMRDFGALSTDWTLRRETDAVPVGNGTFFPDFTLHKGPHCVYIELVGYYTPEFVASKLEALRQARLSNMIVCIDESLACADGEVTADEVIRFHKRVDARALLEAAERCVLTGPRPDDAD
jgi:predicted nuclease of restriction endonuclease-like RecB superfamily